MLGVMAGPHPRDPFSLPDEGADYLAATHHSVSSLRIAYSPNFNVFPVEERVAAIVGEAVRAFEETGARVEEASIGLKRSHKELCNLWMREVGVRSAAIAASLKNAGVVDLLGEHREELMPQFAELLETGRNMNAVEYKLDDVARTEVFDALQNVFDAYDLLVTPTLAIPPFNNAEDCNTLGPSQVDGEEVDPLLGWCLTHLINYTGHPAASIPAGFTDDGLPVGLQLIGRRFADETVLAASAAFERLRPWHDAYAALV
jgi:amidase/aspartyl-tRNA(Asn)/glutamyl-tRNA(Gln) amidotransferase subunit A